MNCALEYAVSGVTSLGEVLRVAGGLDAEADVEISGTEVASEVSDD